MTKSQQGERSSGDGERMQCHTTKRVSALQVGGEKDRVPAHHFSSNSFETIVQIAAEIWYYIIESGEGPHPIFHR